jgi:hypothetical protein
MSDLIERQDAIDAVVKQPVVDKTVAKRVLAQLPSAEPETHDKRTETHACVSPCDICRHYPPSSADGKPCSMCPAERRSDE